MEDTVIKIIKRMAGCIAVLIIFCMIIVSFSRLMERKGTYKKYADFFESSVNFDILFAGSSHMLNAILPMELWNDYGIASYNIANAGSPIPSTYWTLVNAFDYSQPKLIVIDGFGLYSNKKTPRKVELFHSMMDAFPISKNKIRAIYDMLDKRSDRIEFLCNFTIYHNRWNELVQNDFVLNSLPEKGGKFLIEVANPKEFSIIEKTEKLEDDTLCIEYLEMIIEECQKRNIEVLLTYLPFPASEVNQMDANRIYDIATEYNVNYINFLDMDDVVNYYTDCADPNSHLNLSGALKVTDYLGQYITDNYDIEDHRTDSEYEFWNQDYDEYIDYKIETLNDVNDLYSYFMCLSDKSFSFVMQIDKNSKLLEDAQIDALLGNLNIDVDKLSDDEDTLVIVSNGGESVEYIPCTEKLADGVDSDLGVLCLQNDDEDIEAMYLDSQQCWKLDTDTGFDIRIAVMDNRNQEIIDSADFVYESSFERKEQ